MAGPGEKRRRKYVRNFEKTLENGWFGRQFTKQKVHFSHENQENAGLGEEEEAINSGGGAWGLLYFDGGRSTRKFVKIMIGVRGERPGNSEEKKSIKIQFSMKNELSDGSREKGGGASKEEKSIKIPDSFGLKSYTKTVSIRTKKKHQKGAGLKRIVCDKKIKWRGITITEAIKHERWGERILIRLIRDGNFGGIQK